MRAIVVITELRNCVRHLRKNLRGRPGFEASQHVEPVSFPGIILTKLGRVEHGNEARVSLVDTPQDTRVILKSQDFNSVH